MRHLILITALLGASAFAQEGVTEASVSVSGTNARTSADLSTGIKAVNCTVAVFYRMGTSTAVATTSDMPRPANVLWYVNITNDARRMAFITSGGTGTCRIYPVNVLATSRAAGALIFGGGGSSSHLVTDAGTATLDGGGAGSATVTAGTVCVCSGASTLLPTGCSLSSTTLTIQGNAGDTASYICTT